MDKLTHQNKKLKKILNKKESRKGSIKDTKVMCIQESSMFENDDILDTNQTSKKEYKRHSAKVSAIFSEKLSSRSDIRV